MESYRDIKLTKEMDMKKVVVACQKGGVGKSTLCLNLLVELVRKGHGAAVQDLDPQNSFIREIH